MARTNEATARYYGQGNIRTAKAFNSAMSKEWTLEEDERILHAKVRGILDIELAYALGRTLEAIHSRRSRLKNGPA